MAFPLQGWWFVAALGAAPAGPARLPYTPWQESQPLLKATPVLAQGPAPYTEAIEYARRDYEAAVATAIRPLSCWAGKPACSARSLFAAVRYRLIPYFAWALNVETTRFQRASETFVAIGARAYASASGALDPFAELAFGADFRGSNDDVLFAAEVSFGVSAALTEHVKLATMLEFHERGLSCQSCSDWSPWAERWVMLSIGVELWLGDKH